MIDRVDDAAAALQRALEIRPAATIYTNLGTLRFFQGQYQQAVTSFERAVEMNPTDDSVSGKYPRRPSLVACS